MPELSPQEHVDARILAYYGSEFDEADRLVGRPSSRSRDYAT